MLAVIGGIVIGVVLLGMVQSLLQALSPPAVDPDYTNPEAMATYIQGLSIWQLLSVPLCYAAGAFGGGFAGSRITDADPQPVGRIIGIGLTVFALINFLPLPYPWWIILPGILVNLPFALWGARVGGA